MVSSASRKAIAVGNAQLAIFSMPFRISASSAGGMGTSLGAGWQHRLLDQVAADDGHRVSPLKGMSPVTIWNRITAAA